MDQSSRTGGRDVVDVLLTRVAEHRGVDPVDLEPLATVVDPGLLRSFAAADAVAADSELRFDYEGYTVVVAGSGQVAVEAVDGSGESTSGER